MHLANPGGLLYISDNLITRAIAKGMIVNACKDPDVAKKLAESDLFYSDWINKHLETVECEHARLDHGGVRVEYRFDEQVWVVRSQLPE